MKLINFQDELMRGSIILFLTTIIFNILNYIFQITMAKMLGPSDYGILAVLLSIMYIFGVPSEAIQTVISRYTSKLNVTKEDGKIKDLLIRSLRKSIIISFFLFILFIIFSFVFISDFLNIPAYLLAITGLLIITSLILPVSRGILQGKKKFWGLGGTIISDGGLKVFFAILLVLIGFGAGGAITAVVISTLGSFLFSFIFIKKMLKSPRVRGHFDNIVKYNIPNLFAISCIVLMYSLDTIFARRFFSPEVAGQYAFVSFIAKVIILSNLAIGKALLPISSENFDKGENTSKVLKKALIMTGLVCFMALLFYGAIPELIVKILSLGDVRYLAASNVLFLLGLAFSFLSFSYILLMNEISRNRINRIPFELLSFVLLQIISMYIFQESLIAFSYSIMIVNLLMLIYSIIIFQWKKSR